MITPTLFNIAAITSLRLTREIFYLNERNEDTISFNTGHASFGHYIVDHHDTDTGEVSDEEHIAFWALWLSRCIFYCKLLKAAKRFLTLANHLHDGRDIYLSQLMLGSLYETLGLVVDLLKTIKPRINFFLASPYWLLNLQMNSMFEPSRKINKLKDNDQQIKNMKIEGARFALMTPIDSGRTLQQAFTGNVIMFVNLHNFTSFMAPFANRTHGLEWFIREFPASNVDQEEESLAIWEVFLSQN